MSVKKPRALFFPDFTPTQSVGAVLRCTWQFRIADGTQLLRLRRQSNNAPFNLQLSSPNQPDVNLTATDCLAERQISAIVHENNVAKQSRSHIIGCLLKPAIIHYINSAFVTMLIELQQMDVKKRRTLLEVEAVEANCATQEVINSEEVVVKNSLYRYSIPLGKTVEFDCQQEGLEVAESLRLATCKPVVFGYDASAVATLQPPGKRREFYIYAEC